jgi:hypothetical protein
VQQSPVDERIAADRTLLTAFVRGKKDLNLYDRQLTDPVGRRGIDDLTCELGAI